MMILNKVTILLWAGLVVAASAEIAATTTAAATAIDKGAVNKFKKLEWTAKTKAKIAEREGPPIGLELPDRCDTAKLYANSVEMLALARYIYTITEMRKAVGTQRIGLYEQLGGSGGSGTDFKHLAKLLRENWSFIRKKTEEDEEDRLLEMFREDWCTNVDEVMTDGNFNGQRMLMKVADDKLSSDESRVHAIVVNKRKKRVEVVFRGTSRLSDWSTNLNALRWRWIKKPVKTTDNDIKWVSLHKGFARTMLGGTQFWNGYIDFTKYQDTPFGKIVADIEKCWEDGYSLYVTGHSLGGATATLFGFFAAACVGKFSESAPVTVFSFSSPRLGGIEFGDAFKHLEEKGKLRHARSFSHNDKVPRVPYSGGKYKHVGIELRARADAPILVDYPISRKWTQEGPNARETINTIFKALDFHSPTELLARLRLSRNALLDTSLEKQYKHMWGVDDKKEGSLLSKVRDGWV